jgi:hypothetical protein
MIASELTELNEILARLSGAVDQFWKDRCVEIVRRNSELSLLLHTDLEGVRKSVKGMLLRGIDKDMQDEMSISGIEADVWGCQGIVEHSAGVILSHLEAEEGERQAAQTSTLEMKRKIEALQARRREHAINSPSVRAQVWEITDGRCIYCDVEMTRERDPERPNDCFEVDHIVAKSNGGPDHLSNYVPACHGCNTSKSAKSIFRFLANKHGLPGLKVVGGTDA